MVVLCKGVAFVRMPVRDRASVEAAYAGLGAERPGALIVMLSGRLFNLRDAILEGALKLRAPVIYPSEGFVEAGGLVRSQLLRSLSPLHRIYRQDPQGRQACASAGRAADPARSGGQHEGRGGDRAQRRGACRQGNRVTVQPHTAFAALHESAIGTYRTYRVAPHMSAFGGKADIARTCRHVRF